MLNMQNSPTYFREREDLTFQGENEGSDPRRAGRPVPVSAYY
jgi:hypothetical protein